MHDAIPGRLQSPCTSTCTSLHRSLYSLLRDMSVPETGIVLARISPREGAEVPLPERTDAIGGRSITPSGSVVRHGGHHKRAWHCSPQFCLRIRYKIVRAGDRRFPTTCRKWGPIHAGIQSLAIVQRIGCGRRYREHCFARLDVPHSCATVESYNGDGFQRFFFRVLRPPISGNIRALSR